MVDPARDYFHTLTGIWPTTTSTYRSYEQQEELYENRAQNPYPVNKPGDSSHQWGLGWDSWVPERDVVTAYGTFPAWSLWTWVRSAYGLRVPTNDRVHGEYPGWREIVRHAGF